jgi:uncharacterized membrane protein YeaQ/YmgE (transglycosylase-associated protein family)
LLRFPAKGITKARESSNFLQEKCMQILWWAMIGLFDGWFAGRRLKGNGYGPYMGLALGIGGGVAGGILMRTAGLAGFRGTLMTTLVAMVCAILLTLLAGFVNGRRIYARQLQ